MKYIDLLSYILITTSISLISYIIIKHCKHPDVHPSILKQQADFTKDVIKSKIFPLGSTTLNHMNTLTEFYNFSLSKYKNQFLGSINLNNKTLINWLMYDETLEKIQFIFSGLISKYKLKPNSNNETSFIGIYSSNSPDSYLIEIASHWGGLVTIPIRSQSSSLNIKYILKDSELKVLAIDDTHLNYILPLIIETNVKHIITIGETLNYDPSLEKDFGVTITKLSDLISLGQNNRINKSIYTNQNTIASIHYQISNSMEDQDDKLFGIILTHKNILSSIASHIAHIPLSQKIKTTDRLMHNYSIDNGFGYVLQAIACFSGASIVFDEKTLPFQYTLDLSVVIKNISFLKPTIYGSGTHVLKEIQKLIESRYGQTFLFRRGLKRKDRYLTEGRLVSDCVYDMFVFREIRDRLLGGLIRIVYLDLDGPVEGIDGFYRALLGAQVIEVLNRPELSVTATVFYDYQSGTVGSPMPGVEIKWAELDSQEILVRGPSGFLGCWKKDGLDLQDWIYTGIKVEALSNGRFILIDS